MDTERSIGSPVDGEGGRTSNVVIQRAKEERKLEKPKKQREKTRKRNQPIDTD